MFRTLLLRSLFLGASGVGLALAQTSTDVTLNLNFLSGYFAWSNTFVLSQSGPVSSLGNATLVFTGSTGPNTGAGSTGLVQITAGLYFNELDSVAISYSESDLNFASAQTVTMSGGTIAGGTGKYAGATGSLDLTIVKDDNNPAATYATTSGSGTLTVGGNTMPLTLTNFRGECCSYPPTREEDTFSTNLNVTGSLGNGTGTLATYYYQKPPSIGSVAIVFNSTDTLNLWYTYKPDSQGSPPASFSGFVIGGTGKYLNAQGKLNVKPTGQGFQATGTISFSTSSAMITQVKTAYGLPQVAFNTWLEIHGKNLVPADTPATGVDWSNAPDFANGQMPTQLGPVSATVDGAPAYIYWYCSAATNPNCVDDQINVLAPLLALANPAPSLVSVSNNSNLTAIVPAFRSRLSPTFLSLDAAGHVAARHQDASLVGPASFYPGYSTPAKTGEIISAYGIGFGPPAAGSTITEGASAQSGSIQANGLDCWISGVYAPVLGALVSPGLYQFNITIPSGVPSGDNPVNCVYAATATFPGALIAVQ